MARPTCRARRAIGNLQRSGLPGTAILGGPGQQMLGGAGGALMGMNLYNAAQAPGAQHPCQAAQEVLGPAPMQQRRRPLDSTQVGQGCQPGMPQLQGNTFGQQGYVPRELQLQNMLPPGVAGAMMSPELLQAMVAGAVAAHVKASQSGYNLLSEGGADRALEGSGARGAAAYSRQRQAFESNPVNAWLDFRAKARFSPPARPSTGTSRASLHGRRSPRASGRSTS